MEAGNVVWCLLVLAALVVLEILALRRFYATIDPSDACHCDQPWRGEFIANFGHEPEASRLGAPAPPIPVRPFRTPFRHRAPRVAGRPGGLRPGPAL